MVEQVRRHAVAPGDGGDGLSRCQTLLDDPQLLLRRPGPPTRRPGDHLDPLIVLRHEPAPKDTLEPSYLRRVSGRNGGQFKTQQLARLALEAARRGASIT